MCWCSAATGRALQSPPGLFRLASREGIVLAFETLELEILPACRCPDSISTLSPLLTYHHAVQTYLARRFGKASRPPHRKAHQLTPPRAGPSALLRCKPFDRRAQYAPTHTFCLHERTLQLTGNPGYATTNTDIFKPTKFGGKYTVTLIPGMRRAKSRANLQQENTG